MSQGHKDENPQSRFTFPDLFRIKRIPARSKDVSCQFFWDVETSGEFYLQPYGSSVTPLASDEQVDSAIFRRDTYVVLVS